MNNQLCRVSIEEAMNDIPAAQLSTDELAGITGAANLSASNVAATIADITGGGNLTADQAAAMITNPLPSASNLVLTSGSVNNTKKNVYYTMKESIDKIVDALKYLARYNLGA